MILAGILTGTVLVILLFLHFANSGRNATAFASVWGFVAGALVVSFGLAVWLSQMPTEESHISRINVWLTGFVLSLFVVAWLRTQRPNAHPKPKKTNDPMFAGSRTGPSANVFRAVVALLALAMIISGWIWYLK